MTKNVWKWVVGLAIALPLIVFLLLIATFQAAGAMSIGQQSGCRVPARAVPDPSSAQPAPEDVCYPGSQYGPAVVQWARKMADALYVNPACGSRRGGTCNDTWYTSAFPQAVIQYGQTWCAAHHDCEDWANGTYQCVSFVRGAYSQVYPMKYTNDAFGLWATYQNLSG
ncbi:MAG TPA: hypothetical protein VFV38_44630 [Ktedonobacteraceae bacterium]|nr:hypothetical protein [Ktedonobacteraceae bacterium]